MLHHAFRGRIALRSGFPATFLIAMIGLPSLASAPVRASLTTSYTAANSATQTAIAYDDEGEDQVDFTINGGSGTVTLVSATPSVVTIGNSELDDQTDNIAAVGETGLTISRQFTIGGVTLPLTQIDDLSGGENGGDDATVDVHAGPTVTFDLGSKGQVDVTPQEYKYDLNTNPAPPGYQYTLLLRAPAASPKSLTASPNPVTYPATSTGKVTLAQAAPAGGENVVLASSNPTVTVPVLVPVAAGATSVTFPITTSRVDVNTSVTLTATAEQKSVTTTLTVQTRPETMIPYAFADLPEMEFSDPSGSELDFSITGVSGTVGLAVGIPYTITVGSYNLSGYLASFGSVGASDVPIPRDVTISGVTQSLDQTINNLYWSDNGNSADDEYDADIGNATPLAYDFGSQGVVIVSVSGLNESVPTVNTPVPVTFTLLPPYSIPNSVVVSPAALYGGATSYGRVSIAQPAPTGGAAITLGTSNGNAATVPPTVTIPTGKTSITFPITTYTVGADTPVTITAEAAGGRSASGILTILARYGLSGHVTGASGALAGAIVTASSTGTFTLSSAITPNLAIPDDTLAGVTSTLSPKGSGPLASIIVGVDITHPKIGDLMLTLTSPDGTSVVLQTPSTSSAQNLDTSYPVLKSTAQSLSAFVGKSVLGVWTLKVADTGSGNVGTLNGWNLTFSYSGTQKATAVSSSNGTYAISGLKESTYGVSASKSGYTFLPSSQSVTIGPSVSPSSPTDINFTAPQH